MFYDYYIKGIGQIRMSDTIICPHCTNSDKSMIEETVRTTLFIVYTCVVCSKIFSIKKANENQNNS